MAMQELTVGECDTIKMGDAEYCIIAVSFDGMYGNWGKDATITEAKKKLRAAGGKVKGCKLFLTHPDTYIEMDGLDPEFVSPEGTFSVQCIS